MLARGTVATPCLRAQWLPQRRLRTGDTPRVFASNFSIPLTRLVLALVF